MQNVEFRNETVMGEPVRVCGGLRSGDLTALRRGGQNNGLIKLKFIEII